jgi:AraC-like DNA-binding protein
MALRYIRIAESISRLLPGAPYYAYRGRLGDAGPHRHDYAEVVAVLAGEGRHLLSTPTGEVRAERMLPGQMWLFRAIDAHELFGIGAEGMTIFNVAWPIAPWETFVGLAELDRSWLAAPDPPRIAFDLDDPDVLRPFERALDRLWNGGTTLDLIDFWADVIPRFVPRRDAAPPRSAPAWLEAGLAAFGEEDNLRGGMERLVELCHVSPAHLWRSTQRYLGLTPTELVAHLRLRHAAVLLTTTDESVGTIAARCGFSSTSYFGKEFRRVHLVTPRAYRARSQQR